MSDNQPRPPARDPDLIWRFGQAYSDLGISSSAGRLDASFSGACTDVDKHLVRRIDVQRGGREPPIARVRRIDDALARVGGHALTLERAFTLHPRLPLAWRRKLGTWPGLPPMTCAPPVDWIARADAETHIARWYDRVSVSDEQQLFVMSATWLCEQASDGEVKAAREAGEALLVSAWEAWVETGGPLHRRAQVPRGFVYHREAP